jgi:hypothetical protein
MLESPNLSENNLRGSIANIHYMREGEGEKIVVLFGRVIHVISSIYVIHNL